MCVRTILKQLMGHKYMQNSLSQALTTLISIDPLFSIAFYLDLVVSLLEEELGEVGGLTEATA